MFVNAFWKYKFFCFHINVCWKFAIAKAKYIQIMSFTTGTITNIFWFLILIYCPLWNS